MAIVEKLNWEMKRGSRPKIYKSAFKFSWRGATQMTVCEDKSVIQSVRKLYALGLKFAMQGLSFNSLFFRLPAERVFKS